MPQRRPGKELVLAGPTWLLVLITLAHATPEARAGSPGNASHQPDKAPVEEIIQDTMQLLDALDRKLGQVSNKSLSGAARADERSQLVGPAEARSASAHQTEESAFEQALLLLADGFLSGRRQANSAVMEPVDEPKAAASMESPSLVLGSTHSEESGERKRMAKLLLAMEPENNQYAGQQQQLASDSTERHIRFTLDLMQSIFSSQSYTSKTNLIESFLISPLSIQTVLMMMHLGARGQTRREIADCLHLAASREESPAGALLGAELGSPISGQAKLKRRHQSHLSRSSNQQALAEPAKLQSSQMRHQQGSSSNPHDLFGAALRNLLRDPIVTKALTSANQIFLQKNLPLAAQYDWAIRHYYGADVKLVDFQQQQQQRQQQAGLSDHLHNSSVSAPPPNVNGNSSMLESRQLKSLAGMVVAREDLGANNVQQIVNEWVERMTKGKISNLLSAPISSATLLMAINVIYFRGDWQYKFDPSDTEPDAWFTQANGKAVKLPMMVNRLPLAFAHDPLMKTSVIELPYKAQRLGLFLLLPDEVSGIFHTMQMLNSSTFASLISSMRKPAPSADQTANAINVRIPKFSIESSPKLSQILSQQLGLKSLFMSDSADLSGMFAPQPLVTQKSSQSNASLPINGAIPNQQQLSHEPSVSQLPPQVGLDELIHKAVLQVDEQGSVAAAASATIVERVGAFNGNYFEADHPFLLFLMDKQTGLVLFSGVFAGNGFSSSSAVTSNNNNNNNNNIEAHKQRLLNSKRIVD